MISVDPINRLITLQISKVLFSSLLSLLEVNVKSKKKLSSVQSRKIKLAKSSNKQAGSLPIIHKAKLELQY